MSDSVDLTLYLFRRLRQLGIQSLHGVPGDYNLSALDYLTEADLKWVGNCNELNGGYAADGYARVKGISAMVTTYGVGELSALNAHAGAYAERVPVIHIVGSAAMKIRDVKDMIFHHTLGNYDYEAFARCYKNVSVAQLALRDPKTAPEQIDNILLECWLKKGPVYIELPMDMVSAKVNSSRLAAPLILEYPKNPKQEEAEVVKKIIDALLTAQRPSMLVGMWALRHKATLYIDRLIKISGLPTFVTIHAQGGVDESSPHYRGIYSGPGSAPKTQEIFEQSDLILHIGPHNTDVSTFMKEAKLPQQSSINIHVDKVELQGVLYHGVHLRSTIEALLEKLETSRLSFQSWAEPANMQAESESTVPNGDADITHSWLWPNVSRFLQESDIIISETGTASFGVFDTKMPKNSILINPSVWASIGYGIAGAQGAALAAKEEGAGRRTILFEGDGSFQLTVQELSTMIKLDLRVTIFILNNGGYTIERAIHDTTESYNEIACWNYADILHVFEGVTKKTRSYQVRKVSELRNLMDDKDFANFMGVQLVEVFMPKFDVPRFLNQLSSRLKDA